MTKTLPLVVIALGAFAPSAYAFDWVVRSTLTETVEISDNRRVLTPPPGTSYTSISTLLFDATASTRTSRFNINGNLTYNAYAGPGETNTLNTLNNSVGARFEHTDKHSTYFASVSRNEADTSTLQLEETGVSTLTGTTVATTFSGGIRHQLTRRDTIAWLTTYSESQFTGSSTTPAPFNNLTSSLNYTHRVSPLMALTSSLQYQQLSSTSATQSDTTIWQAFVGAQTELSRRFSVQASVGTSIRDGGATPTSPEASGTGLLFNASMRYRLIRFLEASMTISRSQAPTSFGQIQSSDTVSGALRYTINSTSFASFLAAFSSTSGVDTFNSFNAIASYNKLLARGVNSSVSYRYFERDGVGGSTTTAHSNTVVFRLTKDVTVLP